MDIEQFDKVERIVGVRNCILFEGPCVYGILIIKQVCVWDHGRAGNTKIEIMCTPPSKRKKIMYINTLRELMNALWRVLSALRVLKNLWKLSDTQN